MSDTVQNIINDAFAEIGVFAGTQTPDATSSALALRVLNRELDQWAALKRFVWAVEFSEFTLTPNHQPHLLGPGLTSPDFAVAQRPVRIEGANLVLTNVNPVVDLKLNIRDAAWWRSQTVKGIATDIPTDLYYEPDWPNGSIFLWPVPTFAYGIRLELWTLISQFTSLAAAFSFPPGYLKAIVLTLAEKLCRAWGRPSMPDLIAEARDARAKLQTANISSPRIASADFGTGGSRGGLRSSFNYLSGMPSSE